MKSIPFPVAHRSGHSDVYFGTQITDPYRALEDFDASEPQAWLKEQERFTEDFFTHLPRYQAACDYLSAHWQNASASLPIWAGERCLQWVQSAAQPTLTIRVGEQGTPVILQDFNQLPVPAEFSVSRQVYPSPGGHYLVYLLYEERTSSLQLVIHDLVKNRPLSDSVHTDFPITTIAWHPNENGFFYNRFERTSGHGGVYWHRLGAETDECICDQADGLEQFAFPYPGGNGEHFLIHFEKFAGARGGWGYRTFSERAAIVPLLDLGTEYRFAYIGCLGSQVFFATDFQAPNWRIVALDLHHPGLENLREVVAEQREPLAMYAGVNEGKLLLAQGRLLVTYVKHNTHNVRIFDPSGTELGEVALPPAVQVEEIRDGERDSGSVQILLQTYLAPSMAFSCDLESGGLLPLDQPLPGKTNYVVERVFYPSRDGTRIPMTLIHQKDLVRDESHKVLLTGYGGWGVSFLPKFENDILMWLEWGGIFAAVNLRGGNEYGEPWHQAGSGLLKQNTFDDFCAAAEWLSAEKYTTASQIAITGATGGGLLTTACALQRPELFGAVIAEAPVVDLLRFVQTPFGGNLVKAELGDPQDSQRVFEEMCRYSPLQNVCGDKDYPPMLLVIGERDRHLAPGQIFKLVAELQSKNNLAVLRYFRGTSFDSKNKEQMLIRQATKAVFAWEMCERKIR